MAYTPTEWTTGDTITATAMNKIEDGIASAGGYDLVISINKRGNPETCTIVSGNILDCEDKMDNGETVNAVCIINGTWSWKPSTANTQYTGLYLPLVLFEAPYTLLKFGGVYHNGGTTLYCVYANVSYDPDTGEITNHASGGFTK
jgi:hypothetical protein